MINWKPSKKRYEPNYYKQGFVIFMMVTALLSTVWLPHVIKGGAA